MVERCCVEQYGRCEARAVKAIVVLVCPFVAARQQGEFERCLWRGQVAWFALLCKCGCASGAAFA